MPTQTDIAEHLDLSQGEVSRMLGKLGLDWKSATMTEIRVAYVRQLRAQAAGHRSEDGDDLVRERVLTERVDRELKTLQLEEKRGRLVNVEQLEEELQLMHGAFRSELLAAADKIVGKLRALYGVDVDPEIVNEEIYAALSQLARYEAGDPRAAAPAVRDDRATGADDDDGMGEEASPVVGEGDGDTGPLQP